MTCLQQLEIVHATSQYQKLTDPFSERAHLALDFIRQLEKTVSQTFNTWEEVQFCINSQSNFRKFLALGRFNKAQINNIIEGFVIITKAERIYNLSETKFEEVWHHIHPNAPIGPLYIYMVKCSAPTISMPIFIQFRQYFENKGLSTEQYLCNLNCWLAIYTQHHWSQIISGQDRIYHQTAQLMLRHLSQDEIEFWLRLTLSQPYEDALTETYWHWVRTAILWEICKAETFRLSHHVFERMLMAAIQSMDISRAEDLVFLKEVFFLDELTQIILWHPHFSPYADKILLYHKIQNRLLTGQSYDDLLANCTYDNRAINKHF